MISSTPPSRRRRVPAMAPPDRRAALIAATVPLLYEHGLDVSTRRIARAAGVAEGTIFGVFPDKGSLVRAALLHALDPEHTVDALTGVDPDADLRARLSTAAELLIRRFADNAHLMSAARSLLAAADCAPDLRDRLTESRDRLTNELTALIAPDADRLRRSPATVARLLMLLIGGTTHGLFGDADRLTGAEMVGLLLDGLLVRPDDTRTPDDRTDDRTDDRGGPVPC